MIHCNECSKPLFEEDDKHTGALAVQLGFVYKNPILFTGKDTPLYFCNGKCSKLYIDKHIPKNEAITAALKELKKEIPQMAKDTAKAMGKFINHLKQKQNEQSKKRNDNH